MLHSYKAGFLVNLGMGKWTLTLLQAHELE